jgi:hypothetical protein
MATAGIRAGSGTDVYLMVDGVDRLKIDSVSGITTALSMTISGTLSSTGTFVAGGFSTSGTAAVGNVNSVSHILPTVTNVADLGSASLRWRNSYTNDLQLSNGIGDYTIVEGEEDLFLYNNKSGKTFKFALIEVDPSVVPAKAQTS